MFKVVNLIVASVLALGMLSVFQSASAAVKSTGYNCVKTIATTESTGADLRETGIKCKEVGRRIQVHAYTKFTLSPGINSTTAWIRKSGPLNTWKWGKRKNAYGWEINGPFYKSLSLD